MKFGFIAGINYPEFSEQGEIAFTLCDWINNNPEYTAYYRDHKNYKITDNMAAENGVSSPVEQVIQSARDVNSNEIWASDKLYDYEETVRLTEEFISHLTTNDKINFRIVGLPQGKNASEWISCYKWMLNHPSIDVIAISKYSVEAFAEMAGTKDFAICRIKCLEFLHEQDLVRKPIHCAGANHYLIHEIETYKKYPLVRSMDSNICFKLGSMGIKLDECITEPLERLDHNISELTQDQLNTIQYNIDMVKRVL